MIHWKENNLRWLGSIFYLHRGFQAKYNFLEVAKGQILDFDSYRSSLLLPFKTHSDTDR